MSKLTKSQSVPYKTTKADQKNAKKPFSQLVPYYMTTGLKITDLTQELD